MSTSIHVKIYCSCEKWFLYNEILPILNYWKYSGIEYEIND